MLKVKAVKLKSLKAGVHELRMESEDELLDELALSIRRIGVVVPITVEPDGDDYIIIAGHRRFAAAQLAGLDEMPCVVRQDSKDVQTEISLAENLFRKDLSPLETAAAVNDILNQKIMDIPALAQAMHRSEHWIKSQAVILDWPSDVLELLHLGKLSVAAASNIALIEEDTYRAFLLRNAEESGATARVTAAWLQAWRSMAPPEAAAAAPPIEGDSSIVPMVPQAPCIACSEVYRTDELSHVPVCSGCIKAIRDASR